MWRKNWEADGLEIVIVDMKGFRLQELVGLRRRNWHREVENIVTIDIYK